MKTAQAHRDENLKRMVYRLKEHVRAYLLSAIIVWESYKMHAISFRNLLK